MFHSLKYEVTFPETGRTFSNDIVFDSGFSAITGPNEAGKSLVLEMLRFGLFGANALRGASSDYTTLKLSMSFSVRGQRYSVMRTTRRAELKRGDDLVASGVTPVNAKIVETLGFGLSVFDTACSINQGEVERLGSMSPMERKRLVDSVLGIDALDITTRWAMEEARFLDRDIENLTRSLREPVEPMMPSPYRTGIDINQHRALVQEKAQLEGWLANVPTEPTTAVTLTVSELSVIAQDRVETREKLATLSTRVKSLPETAPYDELSLKNAADNWKLYDKWSEAQRWLRDNPSPKYLRQQLIVFEQDWTVLENISKRDEIDRQIEQLQAKGSKPCPHCGEDIPLENDQIERLKAVRDAIVVQQGISRPPISMTEITRQLQYLNQFDAEKYAQMSAVKAVDLPTIKRELIPTYFQQLTLTAERYKLLPELIEAANVFNAMPDYETQLYARRAFEQAWQEYNQSIKDREIKSARLREIEIDPDAERDYLAARDYEQDLERYVLDKQVYDQTLQEIEAKTAEVVQYRKVRELMNVLRSLIKQHLMPSLNRVASHLLRGMTGGQRQQVQIDEDFNIVIDGQRLETLSGSGKACANLAIRIALGQVLTNRVISVLLADEIDASMDDFRAEQTANVLGTIENSISQVLIVSHKSIEATHHITLGGFIANHAGGTA